MDISQQVVLVSGGARGLGKEIVRSFARAGARVVINYHRSEAAAHDLARELGGKAIAIQADVRDAEAVRSMVARAEAHFGGPIHTVVHNALVNYSFDATGRATADTIGWDHYKAQLEGSVLGALNLVQACRPGMKAAGFGRIVTIGSNLVHNPVVPYHDYTTGKAALLGFTRNMARELGPEGILVNMVSGGLLQTTDASAATSDFVFDIIRTSTPRQRVTTPAEMADAVLFFASPWSRAVTGQDLVVDGGLVMK